MRSATWIPLSVSWMVGLVPAAFCQSVLYTFDGDAAKDYFGQSVSGAGDVNGDGFGDVITGASKKFYSSQPGYARVRSGKDGSVLYTFHGISNGDQFGGSVSGAGDVNGDGFADLIVGARFHPGSARVFSGVDGAVLYTFIGDSPGDQFGVSVSDAGDVNGDDHGDLIVGASRDGNNGHYSGSARVFSGLDGSALYTFNGDSPDDYFGISVSGAGDVNGDGYDDVIVGAYGDDNNGSWSGSARVFSGLDGSILYTLDGDSQGDAFGYSVSGAGDVNADGFSDVIVGAFGDDNNGVHSGSARVYSGLDGRILYTLGGDSPGDHFGTSVSGAADVNGDGHDDVIIGAFWDDNNGWNSGSARVFSGVDGSILHTFNGDSSPDEFGGSVSGAGDVNGDGSADLIVGALLDDNNGTDSGSARVFSGCDVQGTSYCTPAVPNSSGQSAAISACGSDLADGGYFMLHATDLPTNRFGYFLASQTQDFIANPGDSQGNLCLGGNIDRFVKQVQSSGFTGSFSSNVPQWAMPGETWNFQAWFRDMNPGPTSNFTDAVAVTFL